jgi:hypothetical protein
MGHYSLISIYFIFLKKFYGLLLTATIETERMQMNVVIEQEVDNLYTMVIDGEVYRGLSSVVVLRNMESLLNNSTRNRPYKFDGYKTFTDIINEAEEVLKHKSMV